jgi:hypothetical protein
MNDEEIIRRVFVWIDDQIGELSIDPQPGPVGRLSLSEILSLMVLHHLLKPFWSLKGYCRWLAANWRHFFPHLVEYSRLTRLFNQAKEFLSVLLKKLSKPNRFGLVADGTALPVMHVKALTRKAFGTLARCIAPAKMNGTGGFCWNWSLTRQDKLPFSLFQLPPKSDN